MSSVLRSVVTGVGGYLPAEIVTNDDLAKIVDTSDAWIVERTGIRQRRRAAPTARPPPTWPSRPRAKALAAAGRTPADVDLIIVATTTPDLTFPATAAHRAAQARRADRHRLRRPGGLLRLRLCAGVADSFVARGLRQLRAGHRRRRP